MAESLKIAITGIGCRFPGGANSPASLWKLLLENRDALGPIPKDRFSTAKFYNSDMDAPGKIYFREGGFIEQPIYDFDPGFFSISPKEVATLDPQQRLLLEVVWDAILDAGYDLDRLPKNRIGVFIGGFMMDSYHISLKPSNSHQINQYSSTGSTPTVLSARISYTFGFGGPCITVDTACSSSLVATHYAAQSIRAGECDLAIVGGTNIMLDPEIAISLCKARLVSPDARSKAFDESANGYARGEGVGVVILRPLSDALKCQDHIYSSIISTACNNDGHSEGGVSTPSQEAQERLLKDAYQKWNIHPEEVAFIEAHGTGTQAGDLREAGALGAILGMNRDAPLRIGSIKTNIGHTEGAAGVAGLIKAALCLKNRKLPASLHFNKPNPKIPFSKLNVRVVSANEDLDPRATLVAGVNSFGYGGTNAHVVLESPPTPRLGLVKTLPESSQYHLIPVSANSVQSLRNLAQSYVNAIDNEENLNQTNFIHTLSNRRTHHGFRSVIVANNISDIRQNLALISNGTIEPTLRSVANPIVWVYSGMGPQWWAMGRELLKTEPVFRSAIEECSAGFSKFSSWVLIDELEKAEPDSKIDRNYLAQPANFAVQIGLTMLWKSFGVSPGAIVGHSIGEVAAAYAAGCLTLAEAIRVTYYRSFILEQIAGKGQMMAVEASEAKILPMLKGMENLISLAAVNSPNSLTLSGDTNALLHLSKVFEKNQIFFKILHVEVPYHSCFIDPIAGDLVNQLGEIQFFTPKIPLYSTVTGSLVNEALHDGKYWKDNFRNQVRFKEAIEQIAKHGYLHFLEIGAHPVLANSISETYNACEKKSFIFNTLLRKKPERKNILENLGQLYAHGHDVDWASINPDGCLLSLPGYPWERSTYLWTESDQSRKERFGEESNHPLLQIKDSSPTPTWRSEVSCATYPYLIDHKIENTIVFPGSGYLEIALALMDAVAPDEKITVCEVEFHKALGIQSTETTEIVCQFERRNNACFGIYSVNKASGRFAAHATGNYSKEAVPSSAPALSDLRNLIREKRDAAKLYADLKHRGYDYGPKFRCVKLCYVHQNETLCKLEADSRLEGDNYIFHPALLDAVLHSSLANLPDASSGKSKTYLPVSLTRMTIFEKRAPGPIWVHSRKNLENETFFGSDLTIYDGSGAIIAEIVGLISRALENVNVESKERKWFYNQSWQIAKSNNKISSVPKDILVLSDNFLGELIKTEFRRRKRTVDLVEKRESWIDRQSIQNALSGKAELICSWDFGQGAEEASSIDDAIRTLGVLLDFIQVCLKTESVTGKIVIWMLTPKVHDVGTQALLQHQQAMVWGFKRVLANECPQIDFRLVDMTDVKNQRNLTTLYDLIEAPYPNESEYLISDGEIFVRRINSMPSNVLAQETIGFVSSSMEWQMRGIAGDSDSYRFNQIKSEPLANNELRIKTKYSSFSKKDIPSDIFDAKKTWSLRGGPVVEIGDRVNGLVCGDEVLVLTPQPLSSHTIAGAETFVRIPADFAPEWIAKIPSLVCFYLAIRKYCNPTGNDWILFSSDGTDDDLNVVRLIRRLGHNVFAVVPALTINGFNSECNNVAAIENPDLFKVLAAHQSFRLVFDRNRKKNFQTLVSKGGTYCFVDAASREAFVLKNLRTEIQYVSYESSTSLGSEDSVGFINEMLPILKQLKCPETKRVSVLQMGKALRDGLKDWNKQNVLIEIDHRNRVIPSRHDSFIEAESTYLITGGFGGLGLKFAKWLGDQGCRNLVLLGRTGAASDDAIKSVNELRQMGLNIMESKCDVSDFAQLKDVFSKIKEQMPKLTGIVHTAFQYKDEMIPRLKSEEMMKILRPKVVGAWNLHLLSQDQPIETFLLFSSIMVFTGSPGLATYSLSNYYLDALADYRKSKQLPATSINFGPFVDAGILQRNQDVSKSIEKQGYKNMITDDVFKVVREILMSDFSQIGLAEVDWQSLAQATTVVNRSAIYENVRSAPLEATDGHQKDRFTKISKAEAGSKVQELLRQWISQKLEYPIEKIEFTIPLSQYGLDSLVATSLIAQIEKEFGVVLKIMDIIAGPPIEKLSGQILNLMSDSDSTASASEPMSTLTSSNVVDLLAELSRDYTADELKEILEARTKS